MQRSARPPFDAADQLPEMRSEFERDPTFDVAFEEEEQAHPEYREDDDDGHGADSEQAEFERASPHACAASGIM